jgi:hypothetical protein
MHGSALLPALPVNPAMPRQALPLNTLHRVLHFDGNAIPAQLVTYANNCTANVRHIAPMLDKDNVYDGIAQTV